MAAPTLVAAGALFASASGTTITPVIPGGATTNDVMLVGLMSNAANTFTTPTDWTLLGTSAESDSNQSTEWYWKRHDGSESNPSSTVGTSLSAFIGGYGRIYVFRGCITTGDPFEDVTMGGSPTNSSTPATALITTTGTDRLAVCLVMVDDDNTWSSGNPPSGWTGIGLVSSSTGGDCMMDGIYKTVAAAGDVTAVNVGTMNASDYWRTLTLALIPGAAGQSGTAVGSFGFTGTAAGVPETFGLAVSSFGFTATGAGVDRALGAAAATFGFTGASSGVDRALGVAAAALGFTGSAAGVAGAPPVTGAAAAVFGFTGTASGLDRALGAASAILGFLAAATGVPKTSGASSGTFGFTGNTAGVDRALGAAVVSFGFTGTGSGRPRVLAVVAVAFGFTASASGTIGTPPVTGVSAGPFGFAGSAAGVPRTSGAASAGWGFTGAAAGTPRTAGIAMAAFAFTGTASGVDRTLGVAVALFGFTASGTSAPPVTPSPERILTVLAELRSLVVPTVARQTTIPADRRTVTVPKETP